MFLWASTSGSNCFHRLPQWSTVLSIFWITIYPHDESWIDELEWWIKFPIKFSICNPRIFQKCSSARVYETWNLSTSRCPTSHAVCLSARLPLIRICHLFENYTCIHTSIGRNLYPSSLRNLIWHYTYINFYGNYFYPDQVPPQPLITSHQTESDRI